MAKPTLITDILRHVEPGPKNGQMSGTNQGGRANPFKRTIDCCTGEAQDGDPAALVGDGYKRSTG